MAIAHHLRLISDAFSLTVVSCVAIKHALDDKSSVVQSVVDEPQAEIPRWCSGQWGG